MITQITCPVCDRPDIKDNRCPNCETDLSLILTLIELPTEELAQTPKLSPYKNWLLVMASGLVILGIISSIVLGNYLISKQKIAIDIPPKIVTKTITCNKGFNYIVSPGDSLSLIAFRFYGDAQKQSLIIKANPQLVGSEDYLEIKDKLLIPNLEDDCS